MSSPYDTTFYEGQKDSSLRAAKEVIPLVLEYVQPKHVVDVGCGVGTWLSVFREHGMEDVLGIDGDYVERNKLCIPEDQFLAMDISQPFQLDRHFDLVVSVEVAEHLPPECAEQFVQSLTNLAPVVLFSAAMPFQGGVDHLNEQWPDYWANLFAKFQYAAIDCIRGRIWQNDNVQWYHANNLLMFAHQNYLENHPALKRAYENTNKLQLSIVHPKRYLLLNDPKRTSMRLVLKALPFLIPRILERLTKRK